MMTAERRSIGFTGKSSVLVFGAHPDDAVRACGGVILRARAAGATVAIVKATDGAALGGPEGVPTGRRMAEDRKREELHALHTLHFPRRRVFLLGFPDGGLEALRNDYLEPKGLPYYDPWLAADRTHGRDVTAVGMPFYGDALVRALAVLAWYFRPTHVFTHCSRDRHPDHRALTWFVKSALRSAKLRPAVYEYLTYHTRTKWPSNRGPRILPREAAKLHLPGRIVDFGLTNEEAERKDAALDAFVPILGAAYFNPWRRTNEIFWRTGL